MWYQNIGGIFYSFLTKHACDKQTDRRIYDPQDRSSIYASRGKKNLGVLLIMAFRVQTNPFEYWERSQKITNLLKKRFKVHTGWFVYILQVMTSYG